MSSAAQDSTGPASIIAENLRQQNRETDIAIGFINDQLNLYQKKLKESEVSAMEEQLEKLLIDSTERHPMVIELRKKIESAKADIDAGKFDILDGSGGSANSEVQALKAELNELREELATSTLDTSSGGANRAKAALLPSGFQNTAPDVLTPLPPCCFHALETIRAGNPEGFRRKDRGDRFSNRCRQINQGAIGRHECCRIGEAELKELLLGQSKCTRRRNRCRPNL